MITIAIDSAMHASGIAVFRDKTLIATELLKVPNKYKSKECSLRMATLMVDFIRLELNKYCEPVQVVIEDHEYRYGNDKMNVKSFADMYSVGVCTASQISSSVPVTFYKPKEWKGTVPKKIKTQRIMEVERETYNSDTDLFQDGQDDIVDAIGIGRFHIDKIR